MSADGFVGRQGFDMVDGSDESLARFEQAPNAAFPPRPKP